MWDFGKVWKWVGWVRKGRKPATLLLGAKGGIET